MKKYLLNTIFSDKDMAIKYQKLFQDKLGLTLGITEIDEKTELKLLSDGD